MRNKYDNPMRRQCFDINDLAMVQFYASVDSFTEIIQKQDLKDLDQIIVTGCGDSYLAAIEAKPAFDKYLKGTGCEMSVQRAIDLARFYEFNNNKKTLVVAVSASGSPARIDEILQRGKKHGCMTMALTNVTDSRAAKSAQITYHTNTPEFPDRMPGLRNYYASLLSLFVMAASLGELQTGNKYIKELKENLFEYNEIFRAYLQNIDAVAFGTAIDWVDVHGFEVVADGPLNACGRFIAAKYAEVSGDMCSVIDSENYCHVNTFMRPKSTIGTYILLNSKDKNANRMSETVNLMVDRDKRSVLLVSDKTSTELSITQPVRQCIIPLPKKDYDFIYLLYAYIPGSLVTGYHAALINQPYFRGGGIYAEPDINTLRTNALKII